MKFTERSSLRFAWSPMRYREFREQRPGTKALFVVVVVTFMLVLVSPSAGQDPKHNSQNARLSGVVLRARSESPISKANIKLVSEQYPDRVRSGE